MAKTILGIHGLANKPQREQLERWWKRSLLEGLKHIGSSFADLDFKIVFWADLLYKQQLHNDEHFSFDALYNTEPYLPAKPGELKEYKEGFLSDLRAAALDLGGSGVDMLKRHLGMNRFADWVLGKVAKDLAFYYDKERTLKDRSDAPAHAQQVLRDELGAAVKTALDSGNEVMLIAHSMGTIIAYDTLRDLGRDAGDAAQLPYFVTIGSPLGLPHVKGKIIEERDYDPQVRTPSVVTEQWVNFSDAKDPVAFDARLKDDYGKNKRGVRVHDDQVANDYHTEENGKRKNNHHKSYGYLRTPELARLVDRFLAG